MTSPPIHLSAIVLFAHGARNPEWAAPFEHMRDAILARRPDAIVRLAFLELMTPLLPPTIEALALSGVAKIVVVPCFMAPGGHLRKDLPALVRDAECRHPGLHIEVTPPIGEMDCLISAVAEFALGAAAGT